MPSPVSPSIAEIAASGTHAALAEAVLQVRRCAVAAGGSDQQDPTVAELRSSSLSALLARFIEAARNWEAALGGTPPTSPTIGEYVFTSINRCASDAVMHMRRIENAL